VYAMTDVIHLDATALRVLAHPLRSRLLSQLRLHGAATATELADLLTTNTGATSYHLRKLESVGLVRDTGTGSGKRRVWEASSRGHEWTPSEFAGDEDAEASLSWLTRDYFTGLQARADRWFAAERAWPQEWRDALGYADDGVHVTPAQAMAMREEIHEVVKKYRHAGDGQPGAAHLMIFPILLPVDERPSEDAS
ncbi:MAG: helix-turn-helix domain-containing protein, partial [Nocardioides sp.]